MNEPKPPHWVEAFLRQLPNSRDRETVSGWYLSQVAGFAFRGNWLWAALLSGSFISSTALDWFVPPSNFYMRSFVSTWLAVAILLCAGFCASWQSGLLRSGVLAGIATTLFSSVICAIGTGCLLAIRHDAPTLAAIQGSGGLAEVFTLPVLLVIPGTFLGAVGGLMGGTARRF
jgi:hypothetical protein